MLWWWYGKSDCLTNSGLYAGFFDVDIDCYCAFFYLIFFRDEGVAPTIFLSWYAFCRRHDPVPIALLKFITIFRDEGVAPTVALFMRRYFRDEGVAPTVALFMRRYFRDEGVALRKPLKIILNRK